MAMGRNSPRRPRLVSFLSPVRGPHSGLVASITRGPAGHQSAQQSPTGSASLTRGQQPEQVRFELVPHREFFPLRLIPTNA
jgi:hypothetical protein